MTLYELTTDYEVLQAMLMAEPDVEELAEGDKDVLTETLAAIDAGIESKAAGYARIMKNLQAEADAVKAEKLRLAKRQQVIENGLKRLKDALIDAMDRTGKSKIDTDIGKLSLRKNPYTVTVTDWHKLPPEYLILQDPEPDKKALIAAFKATGEVIDGVEYTQGMSLVLR